MALGRTSKCREIQLSKTENAGLSKMNLAIKSLHTKNSYIGIMGKALNLLFLL
jgi:hypothetical protein